MTDDKNQKNQHDRDQQRPQYPPQPMPPYYYDEEEEISLLDMMLVLARNLRIIIYCTGIFVVLGLFIALFSSPEYQSSATLVRETTEGTPSNLGGLASLGRGLGLSLGGAASGLTAEAYPDIIKSREVRLAVIRDKYYFRAFGDSLTLVQYFDRPPGFFAQVIGIAKKVTIGLPGTIMSLFRRESEPPVVMSAEGKPVYPTEEEEEAMKAVSGMLSVNVDRETGMMTVSVTSGDPVLSSQLAQSFINHLSERVKAIRTQKSRENLKFVEERFEEARQELQRAEEELARFQDRNQNITTARLRTEQERLQRQVSFASQLYSDLQTQLVQTQLELQRSEPVITVVEEPVPPLEKSGPNRKLIVILSLFLGGGLGVGLAFVRQFVGNMENDDEESEKLQEIKDAFIPERWRRNSREPAAKEETTNSPEGTPSAHE